MTKSLPVSPPPPVSLDRLHALIRQDLAQVDALIVSRVQNEVPLIHDIARHIVHSGGKRIRPALTLVAAQLCGYEGREQLRLAAAVEFIHTATLLHDDVVDESKLRRGLATANELFGNKPSILVGDFLLSQAFQLMVESGSLTVLKILSDASAVIAKGEVMQLMTEGEPETTVAHYLDVISAKTAVLFEAACRLGAVVADDTQAEEKLRVFGHAIGIAFQLIDDALDYHGDQQALGKTVGDDFREGKITLPILFAYQGGSDQERAFWTRTLSERQQTTDDLAHAMRLLHQHHAITRTIATAQDYCNQARESLADFTASPAKTAMLDIVDFCAGRAY